MPGLEIFINPDTIRAAPVLFEENGHFKQSRNCFLAKGKQLWEFLPKRQDISKTD